MENNKKYSFWQKLKDFFTISDKDLKGWKKKNYESRRQMGLSTRQENEECDEEYGKKNSRD